MSGKAGVKLVCGLGFNSGKYPANKAGGKQYREYKLWEHMLSRCTDKSWHRQPSYIGTTCSENFKSYEYFYEWCNNQMGFNTKDENGKSWQLDKDLLFKGNKIYSEDTCCFVPQNINKLLIKCDSSRGEYPIGVHLYKLTSKFLARCNNGKGVLKHLGYFGTPQEAFQVYKDFKEATIKRIAEDYKDRLDFQVYQALTHYQVEITD